MSCVSPTSCVATGYCYGRSRHGTPESALAETWNGTMWSVVPTPKPVSCASADFCAAVGNYGPVASYTLAEIGTHKG